MALFRDQVVCSEFDVQSTAQEIHRPVPIGVVAGILGSEPLERPLSNRHKGLPWRWKFVLRHLFSGGYDHAYKSDGEGQLLFSN
jgi:hypothetical protein